MALLLEDLNDLFTVVGNEKLDPENMTSCQELLKQLFLCMLFFTEKAAVLCYKWLPLLLFLS